MGWQWRVYPDLGWHKQRFSEWYNLLSGWGSVIVFRWSSGLCFDRVFQFKVLSLGITIYFNPLLSFTFLNDCIFLWRATCCSINMRLRKCLACFMLPRMNSSSASWVRCTSRWFVASRLMPFKYCFWFSKVFLYWFYVCAMYIFWRMIIMCHSVNYVINCFFSWLFV